MRFLFFAFYVINTISGFSQGETEFIFSNGGDNYLSESVHLSWTIGEPISGSFYSENAFLTQGFHQTNNFVTAIQNVKNNSELVVYPNPTSGTLHISMIEPDLISYYAIYSARGAILSHDNIKPESPIHFTHLPAGIYFIHIYGRSNMRLDTIKVIKI